MNRSLIILLGAVALGAAIFAGSYFTAQRATMMCCVNPGDNLSWLQTEFHLNAAEMARIRKLHASYHANCVAMCSRIVEQKRELADMLGDSTNLTAAAKAKLHEIATMRARCQAHMFQEFVAVSRLMPPQEGRRYLAEMKHLTLGLQQQMEQSMSGKPGHEQHQ